MKPSVSRNMLSAEDHEHPGHGLSARAIYFGGDPQREFA